MPSGSDLQDSVDKTREAFRRVSVDGADDRPVRPIPVRDEPTAPPPEAEARGEEVSQLHPFFQGLFEALPEPGTDWPTARRDQWLETARNIFALMYVDPAEMAPAVSPVKPVDFTAYAETRFGQQSA